MNRLLQKLFLLTAVLTLTLSLSVPALAAPEDASANTETAEAAGDSTVGLKAIAAGLAVGIAAAGGAVGMGLATAKSTESIARRRGQGPHHADAGPGVHRNGHHLRAAGGHSHHLRTVRQVENMPLNIDWQQILLHWMNLAILAGGLYFLLYKPVTQFMAKREEHYRTLEEAAAQKHAEAEALRQQYQAQLAAAEEELHRRRTQAEEQTAAQTAEQLTAAREEARRIVSQARADAEQVRSQTRLSAQRELRELAAEAAKKLAAQPDEDPFETFLTLSEGGGDHAGQ